MTSAVQAIARKTFRNREALGKRVALAQLFWSKNHATCIILVIKGNGVVSQQVSFEVAALVRL